MLSEILYVCKKTGRRLLQATLTSIRAAIDRHLRNKPHSKPSPIINDSQFTEANKALNSFLKTLSKSGQICSTVHKSLRQIDHRKYFVF